MGNDMFNDEQLAHLKDRADEIEALRLALETATTRAQSLSNELLDAMHARDNHRDRAATMSLMLDTIEGVATGQPGEIPTAVEDGWSTALGAVVALVRERDHNANVVLEQNKLWSDRCESAERERDEARALAVSWEREFNVANHERLRLWDEAESLCEKLDQFEAAGFPNVASVLDRIALLSRARETDAPLNHVAFLTGLPVELNSLLPEGSIFMHPRTFNGLPAEHPSWLDRMRAEAKKVTSALDGDGRDGFNGSGPFEG